MSSYQTNAFINCPFDKKYRKLIETLFFILTFYEFNVEMSVNLSSSHDRLKSISEKIKKARFTFHDLSRHKSIRKGDFSRSNMPFELGMDIGCYFYSKKHKDKVICILDSDPHAYDQHLSDMSGRDIIYHHNDPELLFKIIPDWLRNHTNKSYDAPRTLKGYFFECYNDYKSTLKSHGHDLRQINNVDLNLYKNLVEAYIPAWKKNNNYAIP